MVAVVDASDYEWLSQWNWYAAKKRNGFYAVRSESRHYPVHMHTVLLAVDEGFVVDHRDGDGLNNRRSNLRPATNAQNRKNSQPRSDSKSGLKGVSYSKQDGKWIAAITLFLGRYDSPEEAARAYDKAAQEFHGDFARLNLPPKAA